MSLLQMRRRDDVQSGFSLFPFPLTLALWLSRAIASTSEDRLRFTAPTSTHSSSERNSNAVNR